MPLYLTRFAGNVHLVTVNDYLAQRDSECDGAGLRGPRHAVIVAAEHDAFAEKKDTYAAVSPTGQLRVRLRLLRDDMAVSLDNCVHAATGTPSWTRSTRSSSTRRGHR